MLRIKTIVKLKKSAVVNNDKLQTLFCRFKSDEGTSIASATAKKFRNFDDLMKRRRDEAKKSILVQVNSENSYPELIKYCSQFGRIESAFHYVITKNKNNFILLEFGDHEGFAKVMKNADFDGTNSGIPAASPFLWLKNAPDVKNSSTSSSSISHEEFPNLNFEDTKLLPENHLNQILASAQSVEDQIKLLYEYTKLNDVGTRLRFLMCRQLEDAMSGIFPAAQVHPFGSSVNGFGKAGCDLDVVMRIFPDQNLPVKSSRLIYHTKVNTWKERTLIQQHLEVISDIMHHFLPGIVNVRRILQARVPIVKLNHECMELDVDLSMNSLTGIYMSELFFLLGEIDDRVRPLTFCVRKWASLVGITNHSPGNWLSNFSLTCLVLFFLQQLQKPILPSVKLLMKSSRKQDVRIADLDTDCTFLRDLNELNFETKNKDNLAQLFKQFLEFYSQFDFSKNAISLNEGQPILKPDHAAIWIVNIFDQTLNVSKNVSFEEAAKFTYESRNAAWIMESLEETKQTSKSWGLLQLFKNNKNVIMKPQMIVKSRMVQVSDLFKEKDSKFPSRQQTVIKSPSIANEVESIRRTTKRNIRNLEMKLKR